MARPDDLRFSWALLARMCPLDRAIENAIEPGHVRDRI
jgi:hypothetical protein